MPKTRILELIVRVIGIIILIVFIYELVNTVLGHSWQTEALAISLLMLVLTVSFSNNTKLSRMEGEFGYFKRSFGALAGDFKNMRREFNDFKTKQENFNNWSRAQFNEIKQRI